MGLNAMFNSNLTWLLPFACLGLVALATARPEPQAPPPQGDRVVTDARGKQVRIGVPFRGSVLTRGTEIPDYLEASDAPDTLLAVTAYGMGTRVRDHIIGRIFPQIVANPRIWASAGVSDIQGPKVEIERLLTFDPGVYMGWYTLAEPVERVGLPFVGFKTFPTTEADLGLEDRAYAAVVGNPARGDAIIDRQRALNADLDRDLAQDGRMPRPRYLYMFSRLTDANVAVLGSNNHYTRFFAPHAGVVNGCDCRNYYALVDAEHVIADDPDIIVLGPMPNQETPDEFVKDPRWRGLTAVARHRVYRAPPGIDYFIASPFWSRWLAELAHPDRLPPKSRELYRGYIEWLLHYRLSEDELDTAFAVKDNRGMANAARFESAPGGS
jgi:ABC-type Fe3+-hydroxamate transport system substrate-binding protein